MSAGAAILLPKCLENISIFFCLGLDIRVPKAMYRNYWYFCFFAVPFQDVIYS